MADAEDLRALFSDALSEYTDARDEYMEVAREPLAHSRYSTRLETAQSELESLFERALRHES